jgi:hypothetical protein
MAKRIELASLITEASIKDPLLQQVMRLQRTAAKVFKNTANNVNIPPRDRSGLLNAFGDLNDQIEALGSAIEVNVNERAQLNEVDTYHIDDSTFERMDGLVSQTALKALVASIQSIIRSLKEEGFEDDEIFDYVLANVKMLDRN